jgi:hypothetical protein
MCADNHIFLKNGSQIFFAKGVTNRISLNRLTKSICPRGQFCGRCAGERDQSAKTAQLICPSR